jgi:hypothetical protein
MCQKSEEANQLTQWGNYFKIFVHLIYGMGEFYLAYTYILYNKPGRHKTIKILNLNNLKSLL